MNKVPLIIITIFFFVSCSKDDPVPENGDSTVAIKPDVIIQNYIGNGVQWGGYDILEEWTGSPDLSYEDWNTLFKRVRFMSPSLIRLMVTGGWNYMVNGEFNPSKSEHVLVKILDFCEQEGINVMLGEWGHTGGDTIDTEWLNNSANFLEWLVETKNYSCIKYFNMVNEPNGSWSSTQGNYALWKELMEEFHSLLTLKGFATKVQLTGPGIAIWDADMVHWIINTSIDLGPVIGLYDIHTYPSQQELLDGSYWSLIETYKNNVPASYDIIISEFGFKYDPGSGLGAENSRRIADDPFTSDDSNMMIFDAFYGVDVANSIMQEMLAGYAGVILWNLDDAMYNIDGTASTSLKRWGFWNILGSEKFGGAGDENIRPWFYPVSLMCRYFPEGTGIYEVDLPKKKGLCAVAGMKDGKYTIAVVNSNYVDYSVDLKHEENIKISRLKAYSYIAGTEGEFTAALDEDGFAAPYDTNLTFDFSNEKPVSIAIGAQSFRLYTNMD